MGGGASRTPEILERLLGAYFTERVSAEAYSRRASAQMLAYEDAERARTDAARARIARAVELLRRTVHLGWLPLVLAVGFLRSDPRPSLLRIMNPLS